MSNGTTDGYIKQLESEIARLRRTLRDLEFYENDPWARNKIRVALTSTVPHTHEIAKDRQS